METLIVLAIVGIAVAAVGWSFYRAVAGRRDGCAYRGKYKKCYIAQPSTNLQKKKIFRLKVRRA